MIFAGIPQQEVRHDVSQADESKVKILYTNYRGEKGYRVIVPQSIYFGATEWHPEKQWLLRAFDVQKNDFRDFALKDIAEWQPQGK